MAVLRPLRAALRICSHRPSVKPNTLAPSVHLVTVRQQQPFSASSRPAAGVMETVKNTIAENLGKVVPGNEMAPKEGQFSLDQVPDLSGKVAVVTGGSEGIGYGCTQTLLKHNISKLFILSMGKDIASDAINAIREEMGEEAAQKVEWIQCDLTDWEAVAKAAFHISEKTDRLDILINNAGRGIMSYQVDGNGIDRSMSVNHFGPVILTSHLLPKLKETAKQGNKVRIVLLASNAHQNAPKDTKFESLEDVKKDVGPQGNYGRTKLAAILYARYLARHLTANYPNILANATHPGVVETRQSTEHILDAYPLGGYAVKYGLAPFKKDQFEGAVSTMYAATTAEESGKYICPPAMVEQPTALALDDELGEKLMDLTWKIVKEKTKGASAEKGCPFKEF